MENITLNNRYKLQKKVGEGAFATVWLAQDQQLGRPVAVKMMDSFLLVKEPTLVQQFQREAQAVARLDHPNIVRIYDMGVDGSQPYQVMEYLPGGDLAQKLAERGTFTLEQTIELLKPLVDGLSAAHAANMIHRDLKPQNILFAADDRPVIVDFGLVKVLSGSLVVSNLAFSRGVMVGTPGYMAPEQIDDEEFGDACPATDLFALAVIAYELLMGARPFIGTTPHKINHKTIYADREKLLSNLPDNVRGNLYDALVAQPDKRPDLKKWFDVWCNAPVRADHFGGEQSELQMTEAITMSEQTAKAVTTNANVSLPYIIKGEPPLNFEWCLVPAGEFVMGSDDYDNEKPPHTVYLDQFHIARYPVTNAQYLAFVQATKHTPPSRWQGNIKNILNYPVANVSWEDATAFCKWASKQMDRSVRLPTEAEWEKAAHGTDKRVYPWGDEFNSGYCNTSESKLKTTTPVDRYPQNISPYGARDMAGNVWEWTQDWFAEKYHLDNMPNFWTDDFWHYYRKNPRGAKNGQDKVLRGGSWFNYQRSMRVSNRIKFTPSSRFNIVGFRCASS